MPKAKAKKSRGHLVIVESPTKARTISRFLGSGFQVESSYGHVRDLPKSKLGVDVEKNFSPTYVVPLKAKARVTELKKLAAKADTIYFATDEDREGEAISWHLAELLAPKPDRIKRIVFHEITDSAIHEALEHPRSIDQRLVDAQQARRVLDRLVGYKLSPLLWAKVARGLSAGRVQSVAVRLIVEREREISAFKPQEYWTVDATFTSGQDEIAAVLAKLDGKAVGKFGIGNQAAADGVLARLSEKTWAVTAVDRKQTTRRPQPPFTTSTLQQAANKRLGFSASQTMVLAQQLYEGIEVGKGQSVGLITYMRTDSVNLAGLFLQQASGFIRETYGERYAAGGPRTYQTKAKGAQEAHEAIRPTDVTRRPETVKAHLTPTQFRLYQLIWQRAVSSQMADAELQATALDIANPAGTATFRATGSVVAFDGWLKVYPTGLQETVLPQLAQGTAVALKAVQPNQHFTEPPARYSEASLVKTLEELGIGRPSTYAPTIATVINRGYVEKVEKRLKPTDIGELVSDLLVKHFPNIVDYQFTATVEDDLDAIAEGKHAWQQTIKEFYGPFAKLLEEKTQELSKKELTETASGAVCMKCGKPMVIKIGRFGRFLACSGFPECTNKAPLDKEGKAQPLQLLDEKCPQCGKPLTNRVGRFGPFVGCSGYPDCRYIKKTPSKEYGACPKCGKGAIVAKRSRRGVFYACNAYPDCKNAYNTEPTGEHCTTCKDLMIAGKEAPRCGNKECPTRAKAA
ncbi:MAG: DNA topoisomerase I [Parcubacteria group bacterium Gr01-1014_31]|nr:MAG: DNA topoisomerase I [Parcubacteria group bacterium Gr01-1014_31]